MLVGILGLVLVAFGLLVVDGAPARLDQDFSARFEEVRAPPEACTVVSIFVSSKTASG